MDARLLSYISITFVFALTPGATTAIVVRSALAGGHHAGLRAALGAALANACQAVAAGFGLTLLLQKVPAAFATVRLAGAAYLAWLGLRSLWRMRRTPAIAGHPASSRDDPHTFFQQGLVTNLLNISITMFYIAIVPTFLPPVPAPLAFTELAIIHISMAFACHAFWAVAFSQLQSWFSRPAVWRVLEAGMAVALIGLAWKASGL
jgi:threonine/homoserine/homoserine lactone efflux protein